ncbi:MAG TPA: winged helix-turn-helix domain-containing protein [Candidatus Omnitrophota bacterium]|nr:winged helix-turn-helix domain-containing protein [Candidatus Omnitrophota bacterium]
MTKRGKLEIMRDILLEIYNHHDSIKITPLLRKSNMSSAGFKGYYHELIEKALIKEISHHGNKFISLTEKGHRFLERYRTIINFIEEFEL